MDGDSEYYKEQIIEMYDLNSSDIEWYKFIEE